MIEKQMNRKIHIQSFISLIFVFMFLFLDFFYLIKIEAVNTTPLSNDLSQKNLGEIISQELTVTQEEIISKIQEKNQALGNKDLKVSEVTSTKAKVTSDDYKGEVDVTFTFKQKESLKIDLSTVLKTTNVDIIETKDTKVTNDEIIKQVKDKNTDLKEKDVQVVSITENKKAKVKSNDYKGEVEVEFAVQQKESPKVDLSTVVKTTNVDTIETKDTKVTNDEIIKQVKDKNTDLKEKDVQVVSITENKKAKVKSNDYKGEVEVEFAVKKKSFFSLFMIAIILSIGVASLALLGYYFYEKNNKK